MKKTNYPQTNIKKNLWFKAKNYGYGWYPICLKGWIVIIIYALLLALSAFVLETISTSETSFIYLFLLCVLVLTVILWVICKRKGEKPSWRWGIDNTP